MTATSSRTAPSPADKAEMIRRHFPALMPWVSSESGDIECPSMTDRDVIYTIIKRRLSVDTTVLVCDCKATRQCTHLILAADLKIPGQVRPTVHIGTDPDAFNGRWGKAMKSRQPLAGLS
jgi:hypothetical protein